MKRLLIPVVMLAAAAAGAASQSANLAAEGKAWWAHVLVLADNKLEGRNVGTPGYKKAVEFT